MPQFYKSNRFLPAVTALLSLILVVGILIYRPGIFQIQQDEGSNEKELIQEMPKKERKKARSEYFFRLMRDPETNSIPTSVRDREIAHAKNLLKEQRTLRKVQGKQFEWEEIGPYNIGGRTRALAVDKTNKNKILAGGVSGGVWKSTDGGESWSLKIDPSQNMSITSIVQDPRDGHTDTWYYSAGELLGNSARDMSGYASYYGTGVFKSTDNGETWNRLESTRDKDNQFSTAYDYTSRIVVNPTNGDVFLASNGFGILRSTDGANFTNILGGRGKYLYADIAIASDGTMVAVLSSADAGNTTDRNPGFFVSNNGGDDWNEITPSGFPAVYNRTVLAFAPSNPDIFYSYTYLSGSGSDEEISFWKFNLAQNSSENRSSNLPNFDNNTGHINTQQGYNMVLAVKPDDPDFVIIGGTSLFRSKDGFATRPAFSEKDETWIGGYTKNGSSDGTFASYPNQHADQHSYAFDPTNPERLWTGHDGGLSYTTDISADDVQWEDKNNGYNVTQYYTVDLPDGKGDNRIIGGTQDNGSPFFNYATDEQRDEAYDIFGGDGGYAQYALNNSIGEYVFVSAQRGQTYRFAMGNNGEPSRFAGFQSFPSDAEDVMFIHPFELDPVTDNVMYYPDGQYLWRNDNILNDNRNQNWKKLDQIGVGEGFSISMLAASQNPANVLYYAGFNSEQQPRLYRLDDAHTDSTGAVDVSIQNASAGSYIHDIAVNPDDADEVLAILSNYRISGIFHTTDGGNTWTVVEGNLGDDVETGDIGPSIRAARILPVEDQTVYVVGTSTGLYSSTSLNGNETNWTHEAENSIGYAVVERLSIRPVDGLIAAATHGRGIFLGTHKSFTSIADQDGKSGQPHQFELSANYPNPFNPTTNIRFTLPTQSEVNLTVFDVNGRKIRTLVDGKPRQAGSHIVPFNGSGLASGTYIYRLEITGADGATRASTRKMTLLK